MDKELTQFLEDIDFKKQLELLIKKLKGKKIIIYGCGQLFQLINQNYNLKELNIIGLSDTKFLSNEEGKEYLGYKIIPRKKIPDYKPDYIVIATLNYIDIIKNFDYNIKLKPLVKKSFFKVLKEIWCK